MFQSNIRIPEHWRGPGCYVIYLNGSLFYIGQSENVRLRLVTYRLRERMFSDMEGNNFETPWGNVKTLMIKFKRARRFGDWLMREARLIRRLKPVGNRRGVERPVRSAANG